MQTLIVSKMGGVFFTRAEAARASVAGEQGETEGLLRYLCQRDDIRIVYFGKYRGERYCDVIEPHVDGLTEHSSGNEQRAGFEADIAALDEYAPFIGHLQVAGYSPTMSLIDNPKWTTVQACSVRYQGPALHVTQHYKLPRLVINNDPRTYPKDQEMTLCWPYCKPVALLDQCDITTTQIVGGRKYLRKSVWARPESWAYQIRGENTDETPCICIAHAHIKDGCKEAGRDIAWQNVLGGELPDGLEVYGKGWEHFSNYDPAVMRGCLNPHDVQVMLRRSTTCPCVSAGPRFYTGKVYVCESQGCIPLLYGDGSDPYTWDPREVFQRFDSPWRIKQPGDLKRIVDEIAASQYLKYDLREQWASLCKPDWSLLDSMLDDLLAGEDYNSLAWFDKYGGYR